MTTTAARTGRRALVTLVAAAACVLGLLQSAAAAPAPEPSAALVQPAPAAPAALPASSLRVVPSRVLGGLAAPVLVASAPDGSGRLYVVEKAGRIRTVSGGRITGTWLDIRGLVADSGERGLLGLAFPPGYASARYFYVTYTRSDGALVLARFRAPSAGAARVSASTRRTILVVPHPGYSNHNGGNIAFGRDGYLYLGTGDGGGGGDPSANAQDRRSLLGKLLRIDVRRACGTKAYCIPPGNPFAASSTARKEIWLTGVRNPWRWSFDTNGDLYVADVGQDRREEVTILRAGAQAGRNLGWSCREGNLVYRSSRCRTGTAYVAPALVLCHPAAAPSGCRRGESITGGFVYRGGAYPDAAGLYVFADFVTGRMWGWRAGRWTPAAGLGGVTGFGLSDSRELFAVTIDGGLYRVRFAAA
jgi:glucose/arabinose dehydrogenase